MMDKMIMPNHNNNVRGCKTILYLQRLRDLRARNLRARNLRARILRARTLREDRDLQQNDVARLLYTTQAQYSRYERRQTNVKIKQPASPESRDMSAVPLFQRHSLHRAVHIVNCLVDRVGGVHEPAAHPALCRRPAHAKTCRRTHGDPYQQPQPHPRRGHCSFAVHHSVQLPYNLRT